MNNEATTGFNQAAMRLLDSYELDSLILVSEYIVY